MAGEWTWRRLPPPKTAGEVLASLQTLVGRLNAVLRSTFHEMEREARPYQLNADWDPVSVPAGMTVAVDVVMPGVRLGNVALAGFSQVLPDGLSLTAKVIADNTVRVYLENTSGAAHDAAAGILSIRVWE